MARSRAGKWENGFTQEEATATIEQGPVADFDLKFKWYGGPWSDIFSEQIALVKSDIRRAKAEDRLIVYLSCPISSRGGGYSGTNVDIAKFVERKLLDRWGEAFWILNPAQYQLESKAGTGLMERHAEHLGIKDLALLRSYAEPGGGDYMRMWTTVLVENDQQVGSRNLDKKLTNTGQYFDAYYFIGPRDVHEFFGAAGETLTSGIQEYFARKFAHDADFRDYFSMQGILWQRRKPNEKLPDAQSKFRESWTQMRYEFFRYYSVRASANFSLGSHDEWLIFKLLNDKRRKLTRNPTRSMHDGDVGEQISGFFDGAQIDPASTEDSISRGYSVP